MPRKMQDNKEKKTRNVIVGIITIILVISFFILWNDYQYSHNEKICKPICEEQNMSLIIKPSMSKCYCEEKKETFSCKEFCEEKGLLYATTIKIAPGYSGRETIGMCICYPEKIIEKK